MSLLCLVLKQSHVPCYMNCIPKPRHRLCTNVCRFISIYVDINNIVSYQCIDFYQTFFSQICRLVYELMQSQHGDATAMLTSLDYDYLVTTNRPFTAISNHTGQPGEIDLQVKVHFVLSFKLSLSPQLINRKRGHLYCCCRSVLRSVSLSV